MDKSFISKPECFFKSCKEVCLFVCSCSAVLCSHHVDAHCTECEIRDFSKIFIEIQPSTKVLLKEHISSLITKYSICYETVINRYNDLINFITSSMSSELAKITQTSAYLKKNLIDLENLSICDRKIYDHMNEFYFYNLEVTEPNFLKHELLTELLEFPKFSASVNHFLKLKFIENSEQEDHTSSQLSYLSEQGFLLYSHTTEVQDIVCEGNYCAIKLPEEKKVKIWQLENNTQLFEEPIDSYSSVIDIDYYKEKLLVLNGNSLAIINIFHPSIRDVRNFPSFNIASIKSGKNRTVIGGCSKLLVLDENFNELKVLENRNNKESFSLLSVDDKNDMFAFSPAKKNALINICKLSDISQISQIKLEPNSALFKLLLLENKLITGDDKNSIRIWSVKERTILKKLNSEFSLFTCQEDRLLVWGTNLSGIEIYSSSLDKKETILQGFQIKSCFGSQHGKIIITIDSNRNLHILKEDEISQLSGHSSSIKNLYYNNLLLITCSTTSEVIAWSIPDKRLLKKYQLDSDITKIKEVSPSSIKFISSMDTESVLDLQTLTFI